MSLLPPPTATTTTTSIFSANSQMHQWAPHPCAGETWRPEKEKRVLMIFFRPLFIRGLSNKSSFPEWEVHEHKSSGCLKIPWLKFLEIESIWRDVPL
jgi:hypothetical protein